jgi:5-(carboxyamino)imidazole ribonucleotide mutase
MNSRPKQRIAVVMGSTSDDSVMQKCIEYLKHFNVPYDVHVMSAHRDPDTVDTFASGAEDAGIAVIIAGAGMAAALPGVIAARTTIPVIGVPLAGSHLNGQDALYSIVQMPPGIPVATVAIGSAGAKNAAILAVEILALSDRILKQKLIDFRKSGSTLK